MLGGLEGVGGREAQAMEQSQLMCFVYLQLNKLDLIHLKQ